MKTSEAREIGVILADQVFNGDLEAAQSLLNPILSERTPFSALDRIGQSLKDCPLEAVYSLLDSLANDKYMGGWVVIGSALGWILDRDLEGALDRCKMYIIGADVWYGADILGERVPGPALLFDFENALNFLTPWREDTNRWVRRAVGVCVHHWAKKSRGADQYRRSAEMLLEFLAPMFTEWDMDAAKGIGWGLKTLGKYYPDILTEWLVEFLSEEQPRYRTIMLRKTMTYLPDINRSEIISMIS